MYTRYYLRKNFKTEIERFHPELFYAVDAEEGKAYSLGRTINDTEYVRFNEEKSKYEAVSKSVFESVLRSWGYLKGYKIGDFVTAAAWCMSRKTGRLTYIDETEKRYIELNDGEVIISKMNHLVEAKGIDLAFTKAENGKLSLSVDFNTGSIEETSKYKHFKEVDVHDKIRVLTTVINQIKE